MLAAFPRPSFTPRAFSTARRWASTGGRPLIGRYTDVVPTELARVQSGRNIRLRDYEQQRANGRLSYDLKLKDGKVLPAEGPNFIGAWRGAASGAVLTCAAGPNGCSLRPPLSPMFQEVVRNFRGRNVTIYVLKEGEQRSVVPVERALTYRSRRHTATANPPNPARALRPLLNAVH